MNELCGFKKVLSFSETVFSYCKIREWKTVMVFILFVGFQTLNPFFSKQNLKGRLNIQNTKNM